MAWLTPSSTGATGAGGVPALRQLDELGEAANRPNKPKLGETRVSPAPGSRIFSARGHLRARA
jgi:hypothetical protein